MLLPHFIIGGTLPAGTGHLYGLLEQHPEVYLAPPMQPECNFFFKSGEYAKGLDYYSTRWFSGVSGQKALGERSSLLLSGPWVPQRLARDLPRVRLIFLLRNPVDRAYANYRFTALAGYEELSFEDALERERERAAIAHSQGTFWGELQPHAYFARGLYYEQLLGYLRHFSGDRMLLMRSDELLKNQDEALRKVYAFLGLDEGFRAKPFSDLSSPAVRDLGLQVRLRREFPDQLDAAIQRIRQGLPPAAESDRVVYANVHANFAPLADGLRRMLARRYAESNRLLSSLVPFSVEDWF